MKKNEAISILATSVRPREQKDKARYDEAVKMAIDALNEPEQQWIPCKREQPTIDGKYNVTIRDGVFGHYVTELWYGKPTLPMNGAGGKRGWFETTPDGDYWYDGVIAWMPLPEPWKGEQP